MFFLCRFYRALPMPNICIMWRKRSAWIWKICERARETEWLECNRHFMYFTHIDFYQLLPTRLTSSSSCFFISLCCLFHIPLFSGLCCCRRTQQTHFHNRFDFFFSFFLCLMLCFRTEFLFYLFSIACTMKWGWNWYRLVLFLCSFGCEKFFVL